MTVLVLSVAEYTELVRQHHTNPEGPAVLTSQGDECGCLTEVVGGEPFAWEDCPECNASGRVAPSRWAASSPTTCPECENGVVKQIERHWCGECDAWNPDTCHRCDVVTHAACPACGGSGATRTIELRTTCPTCDGAGEVEVKPGLMFPCGPCGDESNFDKGSGTVLVGRAASCETVPVVEPGPCSHPPAPCIEFWPKMPSIPDNLTPACWLWLTDEQDGALEVHPDPLPSPGDYALIITGYETSDTGQTEHTQTGLTQLDAELARQYADMAQRLEPVDMPEVES